MKGAATDRKVPDSERELMLKKILNDNDQIWDQVFS
jgi:hypothetical protein